MKDCEHNYIYKGGFFVCSKCGLVEINKRQFSKIRSMKEVILSTNKAPLQAKTKFRKMMRKSKKNSIIDRLGDFLTKFDISLEQKKLIISSAKKLTINSTKDIFVHFLNYLHLPVGFQ